MIGTLSTILQGSCLMEHQATLLGNGNALSFPDTFSSSDKLNTDALITCFMVFHHKGSKAPRKKKNGTETLAEIDSRSLVFIRGSIPSNQANRFAQSPSACR